MVIIMQAETEKERDIEILKKYLNGRVIDRKDFSKLFFLERVGYIKMPLSYRGTAHTTDLGKKFLSLVCF